MSNKNNFNFISTTLNVIMFCTVIFLIGSCAVEVNNPSQPFRRNQEMASEIFYYLFLIVCIFIARAFISHLLQKLLLNKSEINELNKELISENNKNKTKILDDMFR